MTKFILNSIFAAMLAAPFTVNAQTGTAPTPPTTAEIVAQRVARLTTLLDLTSNQQVLATNIFTPEVDALTALRTSADAARTALTTAVQKGDTAGITTAANLIGSLTTQQVLITAKADSAFYLILTTAQQSKYSELKGPGLGGPGPGGPHGPGGPGMHP